MPVNVAILGVGSLVGQGVIKSLRMSTLETKLIGLDFFPSAVGLHWTDSSYLLPDILDPAVSDEEYIQRLVEILIHERADVLLPVLDFDVVRMAESRARIEAESGCKVVVSSSEVARIGDDKWETYQFLKDNGLPYPRSLIDLDGLNAFVEEVGFPLIVKPRHGARSNGVSLVREASGLPAAIQAAGSEPIVQEAIGTSDEEYTCGAVVLDGECIGTIALRRDLRDGGTARAYLSPYESVEALVRRAAVALQPVGSVNFQLRLGPDGPTIFEINSRFSGTTYLRAMAGFNEVDAIIRWAALGERVALAQNRYGVILRYPEEIFVEWDAYNRLATPGQSQDTATS